MKDGTILKQREIVLIPFPYSNLLTIKKRPVFIISNSKYNSNNNDIICCAITSSEKQMKHGVIIESLDLEQGSLDYKSIVKPTKIFTILQERLIKKLGKLNIEKTKEIIKILNQNIEIENN